MPIDLSGLNSFASKVEKWSSEKLEKTTMSVSRGVYNEIVEKVKEYYPDASVRLVAGESNNKGTNVVMAITSEGLWFKEFGTGFTGASYPYMGNYPTTQLSFFSRGGMQHTNGWEYEYHPKTKELGGWWYLDQSTGKFVFTTGEPAQMGIAYTVNHFKVRGFPHLAEWLALQK